MPDESYITLISLSPFLIDIYSCLEYTLKAKVAKRMWAGASSNEATQLPQNKRWPIQHMSVCQVQRANR
jgi:hypothetical protein